VIAGKSVLAVIAARGGSKGLPGKNIRPLGGRPLIAWTIEAARRSRHIDRLILSSDDPAIIAAAEQAGCEAPFRREASLATDEAASIDVVLDALDRVPSFDIVVLLQPTSPLRAAVDIDGALELMTQSGAPTCVTLREAADHPYWMFRLQADKRLSPFVEQAAASRRQDLPPAWCLNGAVYVADAAWLRSSRSFLSPLTVGYPMPAERSIDIDTAADFLAVEKSLTGENDEKIPAST
jgi:N-acylneuraminate cytidylyltransferase